MNNDTLSTLLRSIGIRPYRSESYNPKYDAQTNLVGRTHYVDDDTLRGFRARITDTGQAHDGLSFWLVEAVGSKPSDIPGGHFRFVAFDVFGTTITERDMWHRSTQAAVKAGQAWLAQWDAIGHTSARLTERAAALHKEADAIAAALA